MSWVRRTEKPAHVCAPPQRQVSIRIPTGPAMAPTGSRLTTLTGIYDIDGRLGDLWRCDECGRLWRVGYGCNACDYYGARPHAGTHLVGLSWRPATLWQRFRNRGTQ